MVGVTEIPSVRMGVRPVKGASNEDYLSVYETRHGNAASGR